MDSVDPSRLIVTTGATARTVQVHHRDFPEIHADGEDARGAAEHLVNQLIRAIDSALTPWRRDTVQKAIDDVKAFVAQAG